MGDDPTETRCRRCGTSGCRSRAPMPECRAGSCPSWHHARRGGSLQYCNTGLYSPVGNCSPTNQRSTPTYFHACRKAQSHLVTFDLLLWSHRHHTDCFDSHNTKHSLSIVDCSRCLESSPFRCRYWQNNYHHHRVSKSHTGFHFVPHTPTRRR